MNKNSRVSLSNNSSVSRARRVGYFKLHKVVYRHYSGEVENV